MKPIYYGLYVLIRMGKIVGKISFDHPIDHALHARTCAPHELSVEAFDAPDGCGQSYVGYRYDTPVSRFPSHRAVWLKTSYFLLASTEKNTDYASEFLPMQ